MKSAPKPENEDARLALLDELDILDTLEEQSYDDLTRIAAQICDTKIALVSLIDEDRQWFKAHHGLDARETPRSQAFCAHAILEDGVFQIKNSEQDERFHDNPLVTGPPSVKFYAGTPLTLDGDVRVGTLCVIDDKPRELTDGQIEALEALGRQVQAQLELRLKVKQMEKLDKMKTEFVAMVSHELRTPLTSIYGSISILDSGVFKDKPDKMATLVRTALNNTDRLRNIVNDILDLTKLESSRIELKISEHDISKTINTAVSDLSGYLEECKVSVELHLDTSIAPLHYDEGRIIQILNNLISNAAKFSPVGESIVIRTQDQGDSIKIEVIDHGKGIPADKQDQVFERFANIQGNSKLPGTGLGLNISRELANLHDSKLSFRSEEGKGTTFCLDLKR